MFRRFSQDYGEDEALNIMINVFGENYPNKGMVFAMGTHSSRNYS